MSPALRVYRDAWVMEYTDRYVIGVWVGRPDSRPMDQLGGVTSAALIGHDILMNLYGTETDGQDDGNFSAPPNTDPVDICAAKGTPVSGRCPLQLVEYLPGTMPAVPRLTSLGPLRITAPLDHSVFILNPDAPPGLAVLQLRIAPDSGVRGIEWTVDGRPFQLASATDTVNWPATQGRHVFEATDPASGMQSKPVVAFVQ